MRARTDRGACSCEGRQPLLPTPHHPHSRATSSPRRHIVAVLLLLGRVALHAARDARNVAVTIGATSANGP